MTIKEVIWIVLQSLVYLIGQVAYFLYASFGDNLTILRVIELEAFEVLLEVLDETLVEVLELESIAFLGENHDVLVNFVNDLEHHLILLLFLIQNLDQSLLEKTGQDYDENQPRRGKDD